MEAASKHPLWLCSALCAIWIAETGSTSSGGNKARWVRQMFRQSRRMRRLKAIVWMDTVADGSNWRLLSPRTTARAFHQIGRRR